MRPLVKAGVVGAGYVGAFAIASVVLAVHVAATSGPDRDTYGGMFAFGDTLLFLAAFGVAALPATGAALFFLRPYRTFWLALSIVALVTAATSSVSFTELVAPHIFDAVSALHAWAMLGTLTFFVAPLLGIVFFLAGLFAPNRSARISLVLAATIEIAVFASVAFVWFHASPDRDRDPGADVTLRS